MYSPAGHICSLITSVIYQTHIICI